MIQNFKKHLRLGIKS